MGSGPPGSSLHGTSKARMLEHIAIYFSRESSWPRDRTHISCTGRWILYLWASKEMCHLIFLSKFGHYEGDKSWKSEHMFHPEATSLKLLNTFQKVESISSNAPFQSKHQKQLHYDVLLTNSMNEITFYLLTSLLFAIYTLSWNTGLVWASDNLVKVLRTTRNQTPLSVQKGKDTQKVAFLGNILTLENWPSMPLGLRFIWLISTLEK